MGIRYIRVLTRRRASNRIDTTAINNLSFKSRALVSKFCNKYNFRNGIRVSLAKPYTIFVSRYFFVMWQRTFRNVKSGDPIDADLSKQINYQTPPYLIRPNHSTKLIFFHIYMRICRDRFVSVQVTHEQHAPRYESHVKVRVRSRYPGMYIQHPVGSISELFQGVPFDWRVVDTHLSVTTTCLRVSSTNLAIN